jgi:hypothetical protein
MTHIIPKHVITFEKILNIQVCSAGTQEEALHWLRTEREAGTQNNWQIDKRECVAPVKCLEDPTRTHYIFTC